MTITYMTKSSIKIGILGMLVFCGSTVFALSSSRVVTPTHCNSGTAGLCDNDVNGGKSCKAVAAGYLGDCGGTSVDTPT